MIRTLQDSHIPQPPFFGSRVVQGLPLAEVLPFLNRPVLFRHRWGYTDRKGGSGPGAGKNGTTNRPENGETGNQVASGQARLRRAEAHCRATEVFERVLEIARRERLFSLDVAYGYFRSHAEGDALVVRTDQADILRFPFPRQLKEPGLCLADFFRSEPKSSDIVAFQLVTVGPGVGERLRCFNDEGRYSEMLHYHGFAAELAEALAECWHARIRRELGLAVDESGLPEDARRRRYRGCRYSFGYPACPSLALQKPLCDLLGPERIGVTLSERFQLIPEHSTSALIVHHPDAVPFSASSPIPNPTGPPCVP